MTCAPPRDTTCWLQWTGPENGSSSEMQAKFWEHFQRRPKELNLKTVTKVDEREAWLHDLTTRREGGGHRQYIVLIRMLQHAGRTICCQAEDSGHLPHCQTPSLKRIYTKAHSLNLHLLDLHPESRAQRQEEEERDTEKTVQTAALTPTAGGFTSTL